MHRNPRNMAGRTPDKYRNNQCIRLRPLRLKGEAAISICCSFSYNSFFVSCSKLATHLDGALFGNWARSYPTLVAETFSALTAFSGNCWWHTIIHPVLLYRL